MAKLPDNLITTILKVSKLSPHELLARTPDCLGASRVHVLFPSIRKHGHIQLNDENSILGNSVVENRSAHVIWSKL